MLHTNFRNRIWDRIYNIEVNNLKWDGRTCNANFVFLLFLDRFLNFGMYAGEKSEIYILLRNRGVRLQYKCSNCFDKISDMRMLHN